MNLYEEHLKKKKNTKKGISQEKEKYSEVYWRLALRINMKDQQSVCFW